MAHRLAPEVEADLLDAWYYVFSESGSLEHADRLIDTPESKLRFEWRQGRRLWPLLRGGSPVVMTSNETSYSGFTRSCSSARIV